MEFIRPIYLIVTWSCRIGCPEDPIIMQCNVPDNRPTSTCTPGGRRTDRRGLADGCHHGTTSGQIIHAQCFFSISVFMQTFYWKLISALEEDCLSPTEPINFSSNCRSLAVPFLSQCLAGCPLREMYFKLAT